ncbi:MAG: S16 family serine protease [Thermoplasmatota archaeon]|nr:hypothetical protein [Halobacteriales archaeon]
MRTATLALATLFLTLLLAPALPAGSPASAPDVRSSGPVTVTALAVEETPQGFVGVHATVQATALADGHGRIFVSTKPLAQTDMQGSARLAAQVAASTLGVDWRRQDYLVSFSSESQVIGGPSAGAVMTLALTTALHNLLQPEAPWTLDPTVAGTGTINPDGTIGPVGGVPAKAEGAKEAGITTFLYPAGLDTATTEVAGPLGLRMVSVDMAAKCKDLGISCRPVARLEELVSAAAHVDLQPAEVPVPGTVDYAHILGPSAASQVQDLGRRIDAAASSQAHAALAKPDKAKVDPELDAARANLAAAREALAAEHYYQAATETFQGSIHAGRAENLTAFYAQGRAESVVLAALASCRSNADGALAAANATATTYSAVYAVGAAQERATGAQALYQQAKASHDSAFTFNDWTDSLAASAFCSERARTVSWWADLRDTFPGGLALADPAATAQQAVDDANDLVTYAQAVMASVGSNALLQQAQTKLQAAQQAELHGLHPAAIVQAVEASSLASVAMQTGGGEAVPDAVLNAARQGAARAIDEARSRGIEPLLSVSLVELAQSQTGTAASLESYWTARSLALLDVVSEAPPAPGPAASSAPWGAPSGYGGGTLVAFLAMGAILGVACSGLVVVALMGRRVTK